MARQATPQAATPQAPRATRPARRDPAPERTITFHSSYNFVDKDPVIDICRTAKADSGMTDQQIREHGGPAVSTMEGWFTRATRRPQFATVEAFARAIGKTFVLVDLPRPDATPRRRK